MSIKDFFGFKKRNVEEKLEVSVEQTPQVVEETFDYEITFGDFCIIEESTGHGVLNMNVLFTNNKEEDVPSPLFIGIKHEYLDDTLIIKFFTKDNETDKMYRLLSDENAFIKEEVAKDFNVFNIVDSSLKWEYKHTIHSLFNMREHLKGLILKGNLNETLIFDLRQKVKKLKLN